MSAILTANESIEQAVLPPLFRQRPALLGPIKQHQGLAPSVLMLGGMMALAALFALSFKKR